MSGETVTTTDLAAVSAPAVAVMVYVVVADGFTVMLVLPRTFPTPLSIDKLVGLLPKISQDKVTDWPGRIVLELGVKLAIARGPGSMIFIVMGSVFNPGLFIFKLMLFLNPLFSVVVSVTASGFAKSEPVLFRFPLYL